MQAHRPISNEDGYAWTLAEIDHYFAAEPEPGTPDAVIN
jgi:antitoxin component HigA of HigAB toxin-antitoxin module